MKVVRATDAEGVPLLKQEAKVLIALSLQEHGGIPQVEDGCFVVETKNPRQKLLCLVMEFIEGQNLDQWLSSRRNQPICENLARNWLRQIAAVLERVHRQDIVHRDIKLSNIMLRTGGQLVLIDFGIATIEGRGLTGGGTREYMAPEQAAGGSIVPQTDFYALGRTFVHLLTGRCPTEFDKDPQTGQLMWHNSAPQVSPELKELIDDLMAPLPQARPQNARKIFQRLELSVPIEQRLEDKTKRERNRMFQRLSMSIILLLVGLISSSGLVSYIAERWLQKIFSSPERAIEKNQLKIPSNHWKADFFNNTELKGSPVLVKDWGNNNRLFPLPWESKPDPLLPDKFSALITTMRYFEPGIYLIKAKANDDIWVQIDEQFLINRWDNNEVNGFHCDFFHSEGREYPVTVKYREKGGGGNLSLEFSKYKSYEESVSASSCKFKDPSLNSSLGWDSSVFRWDKNQREPSVKFYENEANNIGVLGFNRRTDGKLGIQQRLGAGSLKGHLGFPADFWVVRSYTQAYFEKGKTYRAQIRASGGFQLLAKHPWLSVNDPNKWVYFTPKDKWQYTDGGYKDIPITVRNDGTYDFHFHLYKRTGNAYIDLSWEEVTPSKPN
jgi:serine/threonine protein kinase